MTRVKGAVLRRLRLPYTTTHYSDGWLVKSISTKDFASRQRLVESRLQMCNEKSTQDRKPYEITFSIAGRFVTDRFVRDENGRWTHHDLIGKTTTALNDGPSIDNI